MYDGCLIISAISNSAQRFVTKYNQTTEYVMKAHATQFDLGIKPGYTTIFITLYKVLIFPLLNHKR